MKIRAAFAFGTIFVLSWLTAFVRLHPVGALLVLLALVATVHHVRRAHRVRKQARADRVREEKYQRELEHAHALGEVRAEAAWKRSRAVRMAREGYTRSGSFDDFGNGTVIDV